MLLRGTEEVRIELGSCHGICGCLRHNKDLLVLSSNFRQRQSQAAGGRSHEEVHFVLTNEFLREFRRNIRFQFRVPEERHQLPAEHTASGVDLFHSHIYGPLGIYSITAERPGAYEHRSQFDGLFSRLRSTEE